MVVPKTTSCAICQAPVTHYAVFEFIGPGSRVKKYDMRYSPVCGAYCAGKQLGELQNAGICFDAEGVRTHLEPL